MKKIISALLLVCIFALAFASCEKAPETKAPAFEGTVEDVLSAVVTRACELNASREFGMSTIECTPTVVDIDGAERILGLTDEEFTNYIDSAIESKPNGSWYTHSVVVIKLKEGTNVEEVANKIVANTSPSRFGCLKPHAIVGCFAGDFVIFVASDDDSCEDVFTAVKELSAIEPVRIDRENTWTSGGGLMGGGLLG
ncbi:MAG: hypothetical protein KBS59_03305 [Clostridiales bacterium]|nr:hypothetical protein [Clostridiales bacterium]